MSYITFIIPTIGRPSIDLAIASVNLLPENTWQIVVVGDGVEPKISKHFKHVHALSIPKIQGRLPASGVRNAGIEYALTHLPSTPYYGFLDDDDLILPNYIDSLKSATQGVTPAPDGVLFRMNHPRKGVLPPRRKRTFLRRGWVGISFAITRAILEENFRFQQRKCEDFYFLHTMSLAGKTIVATKEHPYVVRPSAPSRLVKFDMPETLKMYFPEQEKEIYE